MAEEEPLDAEREPTWDEKIVRLNAAFAERGVPYAFGGAIALNYHREPRSTLDIDLNVFVSPEDEATVLATLGDVYDLADQERVKRELRREGQTRSRWGNTYGVKVDVVTEASLSPYMRDRVLGEAIAL